MKLKNKISPLIVASFATWFVCVLVFAGIIFYAIKIQNETLQVISTPYIIALATSVFVGVASFGVGLIAITYKIRDKSIKKKSWIRTSIKVIFLLAILPAFLLWEIIQPTVLFIRIKSFGLKQYWKEFRFKTFVLKTVAFLIVTFIIFPMWGAGYVGVVLFAKSKINPIATATMPRIEAKIPAPEGDKVVPFNWKYKGKNYDINETLYDSYYNFYHNLSTNIFSDEKNPYDLNEKYNELFIQKREGDNLIKSIADSIRDLGEKNKLNENQIAELALNFVQTIPYDNDKFKNRQAGLKGFSEKVTFPYEVLYENKGVCQDKSYLAYALFKDLGYGVAIFLFQNENHMSIGIKCPKEYSNYDSGYCFAETTSLNNKIGTIPEIAPQKGIAISNREFGHFGDENSEASYVLPGDIGILNKTDGNEYTGIIATIAIQKEINGLQNTLYSQNSELKKLKINLDNEDDRVADMKKKLDSLFKKEKYDDYLDYYKKFEKSYADYEKDWKAYNKKVDVYNQTSDRYNALVKSLYQ